MFRSEYIQARLRKRPFRPLRNIPHEGLQYDIHHLDLVLVGERDLMIGFPGSTHPSIYDKGFQGPPDPLERVTRVALVHVVALEEIPVAS